MLTVSTLQGLLIMSFYEQGHWLPQTPEEAIAEGTVFIMLFLTAIFCEIQKLRKEIKNGDTNER